MIPSNGKRILQTDANDKFWSAILLEEKGWEETNVATKVKNSKIMKFTITILSKRF